MSIDVLNIPLFEKKRYFAVCSLIELCLYDEKKDNRLVSATGAHGMVFSKRNRDFGDVLRSFYWNLPDGMPGVWVGRLKGASEMERCYGPDFMRDVMIQSAATKIRHFLCGGKEGIAEQLQSACQKKFANNNIVGTYTPPFREMSDTEMAQLGSMINSKDVDVVWLGLSTPKQELFAVRLSNFVKTKFIVTVGAAFDFHIGSIRQAPRAMQKIGLEWLFRLIMEPCRLYRRYLEIVPYFIYYAIIELCSYNIDRLKKGLK